MTTIIEEFSAIEDWQESEEYSCKYCEGPVMTHKEFPDLYACQKCDYVTRRLENFIEKSERSREGKIETAQNLYTSQMDLRGISDLMPCNQKE